MSPNRVLHPPLMPAPLWRARLERELRRHALPLLDRAGGLLSVTLPLPLAPAAWPLSGQPHWGYWHHAAAGHRLLGLGRALELEARGEERFARLRAQLATHRTCWTRVVQGAMAPRARAWLGFAFDPQDPQSGEWAGFPALLWQLPRVLLEWRGERGCITFNHFRRPGERSSQVLARWLEALQPLLEAPVQQVPRMLEARELPSAEQWQARVARTVAHLRSGRGLDKVVLSRRLQLQLTASEGLEALLPLLARHYPRCAVLGVGRNGAVLLAASPERLLRLHGRRLQCDAIAGTRPAGRGFSDPRMYRYEHQPVVAAIRDALAPWCESVKSEPAPGAMQLGGLAHLSSPVRARLKPGSDLFHLLQALHPTPAVGGVPRRPAMAWIRREENRPRGWYTGAFGWLGEDCAELAVVLRCGLARGQRMTLYAGAGLTPYSDPAVELAETRLKFEALLAHIAS